MITVVTVVYNGESVIENTLRSVGTQTYNQIEFIVIDGSSTDGTFEIIKSYEKDIDILIREPDKGIYDAMNKGIAKATGEWIIFMNAGDQFVSNTILSEIFSNTFSEVDVIYGNAKVEYPSFHKLYTLKPLHEMWEGMCFNHQAAIVKTSLMKQHPFDLTYHISSDFDFFYKIYTQGATFLFLDKIFCIYDYKDGASKRKALLAIRERKMIMAKYPFVFSRWRYYKIEILYVYFAVTTKKILGDKLTEWVTRFLRT